MAIINIVKKRNPYVVLDKTFLIDPTLSAKAKGLLAYLLSLPADWQVYVKELTQHFSDGVKSIYSGINELKDHGYIMHQQRRGESGVFQGAEYFVYEVPQINSLDDISNLVSPHRPFGNTVKGDADDRNTENRQLINNNNTKSKQNKKITTARDAAAFDFDWIGINLTPSQVSKIDAFVEGYFDEEDQVIRKQEIIACMLDPKCFSKSEGNFEKKLNTIKKSIRNGRWNPPIDAKKKNIKSALQKENNLEIELRTINAEIEHWNKMKDLAELSNKNNQDHHFNNLLSVSISQKNKIEQKILKLKEDKSNDENKKNQEQG